MMSPRQALLAVALAAGVALFGSGGRASAQAVQFFAVLDGGNETTAADPDGHGVATVMLGGTGQICFSLIVRNIGAPTAAHIHEGKPGVAGPVKITLTPLPANGTLGGSGGCLTNQNTTVLSQIRSTPSKYYINVHTAAFPNGAIRGQLF